MTNEVERQRIEKQNIKRIVTATMGGILAVAGLKAVSFGVLGVKETIIEHVFYQNGHRMAVMRDDFNGWGHNRYVQGVANDSLELYNGWRGWINPKELSPVRAYNFSGTTDDSKFICVTQKGYTITEPEKK
jgi:hypothetical protein